jgi:hypothetical protein
MTQFVAKGARSVGALVLVAGAALGRVRSLPDAFARAIERFAVDKRD